MILIDLHKWYSDLPDLTPQDRTEEVWEVRPSELEALIAEARISELEEISFKVVEPCEPDCDEVRHALHQGSWNAHLVIEARLTQLQSQIDKLQKEGK